MSIASEITRLQNAKAAIKAAIEAKGVTIPSDATLDEFDTFINNIDDGQELLKAVIDRSVTNLILPEGITSIGQNALTSTQITEIVIPSTVTDIFSAAFSQSKLVSIYIPDTVTVIGTNVFSSCTSLLSVRLSNSINTISDNVFNNCTKLYDISIPDSIVNIKGQAFFNCRALTSIDLPENITNIGQSAFKSCTTLSSVIVRAIVPPTLGSSTFDSNASGRKIYVPAGSVNDYKGATNWSSYAADIEAIPTNS